MTPIFDLNRLAELIHAPANWKVLFDEAWNDHCIDLYKDFVGLPVDTDEANICIAFALIVSQLSQSLSIKTKQTDQSKVRIGGVTAISKYDYASVSDLKLVGATTQQTLFATEITTAASWKLHESWYRDSRLAQALPALYCVYLLFFSHNSSLRSFARTQSGTPF
jgi:hypothetical protein